MYKKVLDLISQYISGKNAHNIIANIHSYDRWSSFDKHHKSASYCAEKMREYGVETEIFMVPADGKSTYGDWIVPKAWDAKSATLTLLPSGNRGEVLLCNYQDDPCSLIAYSKGTPPEGVTAELVVIKGGRRPEDYEGVDLEGKIAFTSDSARYSRREAMKHGAIGIISDYMPTYEYYRPPMEIPDVRMWERFSTERGGWGIKDGDEPIWGFVLTPRQGLWLRELIRREGKVKLHAKVDARFYDGEIPVVTGLIPGKTEEEVLVNGHLYEVGAIDNASGCGLAIEVLRCLNMLIEEGKLERPRRGIRALFTYECMGTMAALVERPDIFENVVAGITLDCVGGKEHVCRAPLELSRNPHAQSSYTDTLLKLILEGQSKREKTLLNWRERPYVRSDNLISDPTIGIPCPLLIEYPYTHYHTCGDTPDKLDPEKLAWIGRVVATYLYFIAKAGEEEALWLARQVFLEAEHETVEAVRRAVNLTDEKSRSERLNSLWRSLRYVQTRYGIAIDSVHRLIPDGHPQTRRRLLELKERLNEIVDLQFKQGAGLLGVEAIPPRLKPSPYKVEASRYVPKRKVIGEILETRIPEEEMKEWRRMCRRNNVTGEVSFRALCWADGRRNVAEIEELVENELKVEDVRLLEFFQGLERYGYVELTRAADTPEQRL